MSVAVDFNATATSKAPSQRAPSLTTLAFLLSAAVVLACLSAILTLLVLDLMPAPPTRRSATPNGSPALEARNGSFTAQALPGSVFGHNWSLAYTASYGGCVVDIEDLTAKSQPVAALSVETIALLPDWCRPASEAVFVGFCEYGYDYLFGMLISVTPAGQIVISQLSTAAGGAVTARWAYPFRDFQGRSNRVFFRSRGDV